MSIFDALTQNAPSNIFNSTKNIEKSRALNNAQLNLSKELKALRKESAEQMNAQMGYQRVELQQVERYKKDLQQALDVIGNTVSRIKGIDSKLSAMLNEINRAKNTQNDPDSSFAPEGYARAFDGFLKSIDDLAKNTRVTPNLLKSGTYDFEYPINRYGAYTNIPGNQIAPDYIITDSTGKTWAPDQKSNLLRQYDDYPTETSNKSGAFYSGLQLDSIDDAGNISFTTGATTVSPESFSGTIQRKGIGVLNAWAYDNLSNQTARDTATEDIYGAKDIMFFEKTRFEMLETSLTFYLDSAKAETNEINQDLIDIQAKAANELAEKEQAIMQRYQTTQSRIAQSFLIRNQFANLIPSANGIFNLLT